MARTITRANGETSKVRAAVEQVFAWQKGPIQFVVRTIGLARARMKIGLTNLIYSRATTLRSIGPLSAVASVGRKASTSIRAASFISGAPFPDSHR
jgi:hypothetical protein